jgi:hypothetical protein
MDERLLKRWDVTKTLLAAAAAEVSDAQGYSHYQEYIVRNELELALDVLENIGDQYAVSADFWWNLKKADENRDTHRLRRSRIEAERFFYSSPEARSLPLVSVSVAAEVARCWWRPAVMDATTPDRVMRASCAASTEIRDASFPSPPWRAWIASPRQ